MSPLEARKQLINAIVGLEDELTTLPIAYPEDTLVNESHIAIRVSVDEQAFTVVHSMAPEAFDTACLETHFGPVPVHRHDDAFRQLLELNFSWTAVQTRGFGIDKASGDVILTLELPIAQLSAAHLATCMDATRGLAMVWQVQHSFDINPALDVTADRSMAARAFGPRA